MAAWHYRKSGKQYGPIMDAQLKELATSGDLAPIDLIWREGMSAWVPAAKVKGLFSAAVAANSELHSTPGNAPTANSTSPQFESGSNEPTSVGVTPASIAGHGRAWGTFLFAHMNQIMKALHQRWRSMTGRKKAFSVAGLALVVLIVLGSGQNDDRAQSVTAPTFSNVDYSKGPNGEPVETIELRNGESKQQGFRDSNGQWVPHGTTTTYLRDRKTKSVEAQYFNGECHGPETNWHDNGAPQLKQFWVHGVVEGPYSEWHDNGQQSKSGQMKEGKETGLWIGWHPTGAKEFEVNWKNGEMVGREIRWASDGSVEFEWTWNGESQGYRDGFRDQWTTAVRLWKTYSTIEKGVNPEDGRKLFVKRMRSEMQNLSEVLANAAKLPPNAKNQDYIDGARGGIEGLSAAIKKLGVQL